MRLCFFFKNLKLPWGKKDHDSEFPSTDDDPVQGVGDLFGEVQFLIFNI